MAEKLKYPIGIQSFSEIRERGFVYVDKTEFIHRLVDSGKYYFLSRPRRFGKSLLLSTIHEYFNGRRGLFEGLKITEYNHEWKQYPVLHIDLTGTDYSDLNGLNDVLNSLFVNWEREFGVVPTSQQSGVRFGEIIKGAYDKTGSHVVILIDEYDKPLLDTVDNFEQQEAYRNTLRSVYGNLKKMDKYIEFAMLTGVTKLGHLSIFSDLNNLNDISLHQNYASICGVSSEELKTYFNSGVETYASHYNVKVEEVYEILKRNYDGYHFSPENLIDIYNPYSLINALDSLAVRDFWFTTGTPLFLVKMIKSAYLPLQELNDTEVTTSDISSVSLSFDDSLIPLLYQSGYLTIKKVDQLTGFLSLGYPNAEVERGFLNDLMKIYFPSANRGTAFSIGRFYKDVNEGRAEDFMFRLQSLYADFNSDAITMVDLEQHYQDIIFLIFKLLGFMSQVEYKTATGRIALVIQTSNYIYVIEFKRNKSAEEALKQIYEKGYLIPFKADHRKIFKIGVNFSDSIKGIENFIIE
ncbi:MAG: ATP-binding protein [Muribaculaceae bacterium]|nr:ATP-binding protein [Muribaculaceae bacterium]